jgi:hypothetical protein
MGRLPLLTKLSDEIKIGNSRDEEWLVTFSFSGSKPNPHFFKQINELTSKLGQEGGISEIIRARVFKTNDLHGAITAVKLGKNYGAVVRLFSVDKLDPRSSLDLGFEFILTEDEVYSVMKAVYSAMRTVYIETIQRTGDYSPDSDTDQLALFLWVIEYSMRPSLLMNKEDLAKILVQCKYLDGSERSPREYPSFGLDYTNVGPVMKAIETYLQNGIGSSEDKDILFNVLNRLREEHSLETSVDNLVDSIKKSLITQEIF